MRDLEEGTLFERYSKEVYVGFKVSFEVMLFLSKSLIQLKRRVDNLEKLKAEVERRDKRIAELERITTALVNNDKRIYGPHI